ncbi:unnamed protein product [Orchesella dallaii]|uniref:Uncharacterized protein n=1 Tax=Orchesella dallaii TaxID=48710 RepID=A0ABP1S825_9HEXA
MNLQAHLLPERSRFIRTSFLISGKISNTVETPVMARFHNFLHIFCCGCCCKDCRLFHKEEAEPVGLAAAEILRRRKMRNMDYQPVQLQVNPRIPGQFKAMHFRRAVRFGIEKKFVDETNLSTVLEIK